MKKAEIRVETMDWDNGFDNSTTNQYYKIESSEITEHNCSCIVKSDFMVHEYIEDIREWVCAVYTQEYGSVTNIILIEFYCCMLILHYMIDSNLIEIAHSVIM